METKTYQWSIKLDNGEIFVIHSDSFNDLKLKRDELMTFIETLEPKPDPRDNVPHAQQGPSTPFEEEMEEQAEASYCKVHKAQMKERMSSRGKFYSHARETNGSWDYCSGKGFRSERFVD